MLVLRITKQGVEVRKEKVKRGGEGEKGKKINKQSKKLYPICVFVGSCQASGRLNDRCSVRHVFAHRKASCRCSTIHSINADKR